MPQHPVDPASLMRRLSQEAARLLEAVAATAESAGNRAYLVGGVVRDLLLNSRNLDLDVVVEGNAIALARLVAARIGAPATVHEQFGTATIPTGAMVLDLATARMETYPHPGALPVVRPGTLSDDLRRRDFTINAIALSLTGDLGQIIDPMGGVADLRAGLVRVIHPGSFVDDATRILRAVRYEQRFDFALEDATEALLRRDAGMLSTISGDRIRYELERIFAEARPEKSLGRAHSLGALQAIHPALRWDDWLSSRFLRARDIGAATPPVYAGLLVLRLDEESVTEVMERLRFPGEWSRPAYQARHLQGVIRALEAPRTARSVIYEMLQSFGTDAIRTCRVAGDSPIIQSRLDLYLETLSRIKPALTGDDLLAMGAPQGPVIGRLLSELRRARLDGQITSREEEAAFVKRWLGAGGA